jgi:hypothetical protein
MSVCNYISGLPRVAELREVVHAGVEQVRLPFSLAPLINCSTSRMRRLNLALR